MKAKLGVFESGLYHAVSWGLAAAFFYGAPQLARSHFKQLRAAVGDDKLLFILGSWSMNAGLTIAGNLAMLPIYALQLPFFERFKISPKPWPWMSKSAEDRADFRSFVAVSVVRVVVNNLTIALGGLWVMWLMREYFGGFSMDVADLPSTGMLLLQLAIVMVVEDFLFYWCHRTLHHPALYPYVHKVHHQYYQSITLASEHAHPFEFFLGNLVPLVAGPNLLQLASRLLGWPALDMHVVTLWMWVLIRIGVSIHEHCGYEFPWSPVHLLPDWLGASTAGHDFHHSHNAGMYASQFAWWDRMCGTDKAFREWKDKEQAKAVSAGSKKEL